MKKRGFVIAAAIILVGIVALCQYQSRPDGATVESREQLLAGIPKGTGWKIATEQTIENHIISGIYSTDDKSGIAVFEPVGSGRYKLLSREWRARDEIIISGAMIGNEWYDLIWFNGAATEYARIVYTIDGEQQVPVIHASKDMRIFFRHSPEKDYSIEVAYFDAEGNKYE